MGNQLVEIDNYEFQITRANVVEAKSSHKLMLDCEFSIIEDEFDVDWWEKGEYQDKRVYDYLMLEGRGTFKIASLIKAVTSPRKVPTDDGRFEDDIDGGEIVLMNYGSVVEMLPTLMKSIPVGDDKYPVDTTEAREIWNDIAGRLKGKKFQGAVGWEKEEGYDTKARIKAFCPVGEKTLDKWRKEAGATGATPRPAQTDTPDMPDDGLPF